MDVTLSGVFFQLFFPVFFQFLLGKFYTAVKHLSFWSYDLKKENMHAL